MSPRLIGFALVYVAVVGLPLGIILLGETAPERGFAIEFGVAIGFIGLAMLGLQSVLTARYPRVSGALGQDTLLQFHRQAGLVAFALVAAHPVILIAAERGYWDFLDPRAGALRALALWAVAAALPAIVVTSLWRERLRIPYEWWRLAHGALAVAVVLIGLVHVFRVSHYLNEPWKQGLWIAIGGASIASVLYARVVTPLALRRRPYRVTTVSPVAARTWALMLTPERGPALRFRAGQFAAVTIADSPFALDQHPFSIASSARRRDRLEFVVKELGDYTSRIGETRVGARAFVGGPYGSLRLREDPDGRGVFMVAGGIGITPIMSMIRTLNDAGSSRPIILVYANGRAEDVVFADELERLADEPGFDLTVVHVLARPPRDWAGETGWVSDDLLARHLPRAAREHWHYILCGPPPMMEVAEDALLRRGVPLSRIDSERYDIGAAGAIGPAQAQVRRLVIALGAVMAGAAALFASA